ncbi:hypothetical protein D3C80_1640940 [compost metagenome]
MPIKNEGARGAGKVQMGAIEFARRDVVEAIVIDPGQPVGAIGVAPHPGLERFLELLQLVARRFGVDDIQHPPLAIGVLDGVEDLRHPGIQRIGEQFAGMAAAGAPFRCAGGAITKLPSLDRP